MESQSNCLFITYVEKEGPFLKVWGQTDKNTSLYIEQVLHSFTNQFDSGLCIPHPETLQIGILCCAKYKDNKYYRARITSLNFLHNRYIEVNFLDYGHKDVVPVSNIRSLEGFESTFISIQPQANSFLLAEAVCPRGEWNETYLDEICKEIRYSEVNFSIIAQVTKHYLVRLFVGVNDLAILLISKGLMRHTSLTTQEAVLLSMMPRTTPQQSAMQPSIATYKAFTLEPGSQYEVYVSYVTDGPCNFSVQLKQSEEMLGKLMKEINSMTLTPVEGIPIPGTVCLARCMEDGHICRAVVTNEVDGHFKVFYVDFGNFEVVSLEALYDIPFKYVIPKVMAIRFALAGVEKSTVTIDMQCAFKQFVDNRLIHMKVMPMTARTSLPRCELWDPESQISALDIVNQAASTGYPEHISLNRGFSQPVKISYVYSCNRFYVQLKSKEDDLLRLMLDIQVLCRANEPISGDSIKVGLPCYALFEADQQWYRSQIVEVQGGGKAKVHYVDYGNDEVMSMSALKPIEGKQLTVLRPQAIECCLNGYQNMEPDLERDNLLEELILEQEFTMKVVEMQGKKALIELIDGANYNVASLLLDKIATTRSQVSPLLVQAGNKLEHRKSSGQLYGPPKDQPFRQEQRKPERAQSLWSDSSNDNAVWRQDSRRPRNRHSVETDEINENNTWRQNDKGFNKNYDVNTRRDNDINDTNDSDKQINKGFNKNNDRNENDLNSTNTEGDTWRQNNKGFNKNQDRHRDSNRNNDWGGGDDRKNFGSRDKDKWGGSRESDKKSFNSRDKDDWGGNRDSDKKSFSSRDKEDWGGNRDNDKKSFHSREKDDWGGNRDNDKKSFNSRDKEDWGGNRDNDTKSFHSREKEDWGGSRDNDRKGFKSRDKVDWGENRDNDKKSFNSRDNDTWGGKDNKREKDGWDNKDDRKTFAYRDKDNFRKNRERSNEPNDWNTDASHKSGGFKKKPDFKRETSELSSSGSENSFRKGIRDNSRNKPNFSKKNDRPPKNTFGDDNSGSWNVKTSTVTEVPNAAPSTAKFELLNVNQTESDVVISWFHNPSLFYCQIENTQEDFKKTMEAIQQAYKNHQPSTAVVGAPIIALFPEDSVLYRAEVVELLGSQFKVYYVDFGNVSIVDKVWPIETRFMELPAQAIRCKLHGIEPPSDTWPDAGAYGQYFDKKQFLCRFILTEDDRVAVNLEHNSEDIGSLLVRDGLARSVMPAAPVEIPLLVGQQFRAMLISVNSLADFAVSLQNGVLLTCSVFNLGAATETWEDVLREKLEQILMVYVDDVLEDKLEVTLYDQSGTKIKLIDKDEAAYDTVELLSPYLILYSTLSGEISHVEGNTIFIQPSDCVETIEYLLNTIYECYDGSTVENPIVPVEGYVYAIKGSDTNWYRARVTSFDDSKAGVNYLDYGNSESVEFSAIRELSAEFMEIPVTCVAVTVSVPTEDLLGKSVVVDLTFTEAGLEGSIQEEQAIESLVEPVQVPETTASQAPEALETTVEAPKPCGTQVVLSHTDSPSDFYLQLAESINTIEELQANLQEQIIEMPDMENPVVGVLCAAPYSLDQQWYRAQVLDADEDITTVRFVDYGNTDVLDNQATHVKTLPPSLLSLEVHATRCRLKIKPVDEEWSSTASERFEQLCDVESLTAQFINQDEKTNYVDLYSNGINVREVLIQESLALPDEVLPETKSIAFVSHLNSPSEFWIQLDNCIDELEWVAEQLSGAESFSELEDLAPGTLCAALFPDDQMWYRARILSNTVAGIEVLFVDYGNSCTSCSLRELREDLVMLPPLAQKCSLQKPENLTTWGPGMVKRFREISADGQTTFNVKKLSTGETASVELLLDGIDVTTMLLPQTVDVRVKSFEGLDELLLIKCEEELEIKCKLESLPDVLWNEDSIKKFATINDEGKTIFQAEFVSDDTVRLYLRLNDIRLDFSGTKTTPTSSPLKTRSERIDSEVLENIHSIEEESNTINSINNDIRAIIDDIVAASAADDDSSKFIVESIVSDIVEQSASQVESSNSDSTLEAVGTDIGIQEVDRSYGNDVKIDQNVHDTLQINDENNPDVNLNEETKLNAAIDDSENDHKQTIFEEASLPDQCDENADDMKAASVSSPNKISEDNDDIVSQQTNIETSAPESTVETLSKNQSGGASPSKITEDDVTIDSELVKDEPSASEEINENKDANEPNVSNPSKISEDNKKETSTPNEINENLDERPNSTSPTKTAEGSETNVCQEIKNEISILDETSEKNVDSVNCKSSIRISEETENNEKSDNDSHDPNTSEISDVDKKLEASPPDEIKDNNDNSSNSTSPSKNSEDSETIASQQIKDETHVPNESDSNPCGVSEISQDRESVAPAAFHTSDIKIEAAKDSAKQVDSEISIPSDSKHHSEKSNVEKVGEGDVRPPSSASNQESHDD